MYFSYRHGAEIRLGEKARDAGFSNLLYHLIVDPYQGIESVGRFFYEEVNNRILDVGHENSLGIHGDWFDPDDWYEIGVLWSFVNKANKLNANLILPVGIQDIVDPVRGIVGSYGIDLKLYSGLFEKKVDGGPYRGS